MKKLFIIESTPKSHKNVIATKTRRHEGSHGLSLFLAIAMGILVTTASGVDFPESNRRFARLTSN